MYAPRIILGAVESFCKSYRLFHSFKWKNENRWKKWKFHLKMHKTIVVYKTLFYVYCPIRMSMISNCQWIKLLLELIHYIKPSYSKGICLTISKLLDNCRSLCIKFYHSKSWNETYTFVKNDKRNCQKIWTGYWIAYAK